MDKTVVELFAGVGGFRCGLNKVTLENDIVTENGSWEFVWSNQWEPSTKVQHAFECYSKRFENTTHTISNEDITLVDKKNIPDHSLLVGGFPCQDYSVAQPLVRGKGIEGKKGVLWWSINDILKTKTPPFVLLENVDRLLISPNKGNRGRDFGIILRCFQDNGYAVEWRVINAAEYGMTQKRKRVFIFASHKSTNYCKSLVSKPKEDIILKDGIFAETFKIQQNYSISNNIDICKKKYKTLADLSDLFSDQFYNSGVSFKGEIFTIKTSPNIEPAINLEDILEETSMNESLFLSDTQIEKMEYSKSSKKIPRIKPNGDPYFYAEGKMSFPENLQAPARTLLTSEGSLNRSTHVVKDIKTGKYRFLSAVECERINQFPDNWTNTGLTQRKRNFMMGNALVVGIIEKLGNNIDNIIVGE